MRRTYTRERFLDRVALIREHVPDCAITTDIIVGFPGETEADFAETLEVAEEVGFDGAFTFIYSPRRGTEAAEFSDEFLPHEVSVGADGAARRGHPAPRARARAALRRPHARRARRGHLAHTTPAACAGGRRHNKVVNFDGLAAPGEIVPVDDHRRDEPVARGRGVAARPSRRLRARAVLPRRYLPLAVVTAVASYVVWSLARNANDFSGRGAISLIAVSLFWLSLMALVAYAVQAGVDRYRDRE